MSDITVNSDTAIRLNTNKAELIGHERCIELSNGINNSIYYVWTYIIDVYESVKQEVHDKIKLRILKIFVPLFFRDGELFS